MNFGVGGKKKFKWLCKIKQSKCHLLIPTYTDLEVTSSEEKLLYEIVCITGIT